MADKDPPMTLTQSDIIGAVQRGLAEAMAHLNQPTENIHGPAMVAHLERLQTFMGRIPPPAAQAAAAAGNGAQSTEQRAN